MVSDKRTYLSLANTLMKLMYFYITKDDTTELMVILTIPHSKNIRCFRWAKANNLFQDLSAENDKKRLAVRCWNLRLSESRGKLAWIMPSVSKLNKVKQVQHDIWSHLFFILPFWGSQFNTYVWFFVLLWLLANSFSLPCLARLLSVAFLVSADLPILPIEGKIKRGSLTTLQRYSFILK